MLREGEGAGAVCDGELLEGVWREGLVCDGAVFGVVRVGPEVDGCVYVGVERDGLAYVGLE